MAWVQIWQGILIETGNTRVALAIVMALFMAGSAVLTPLYFMAMSWVKAREQDEEEGPSRSMLSQVSQVQPEDAEMPRETMFHGCAYCTQVFTNQAILESHIKYIHPGCEYKEVLSAMPQRFVEVTNLPELNEGIPLSEVAKHNVKHDCWVVIHGKVYDLTGFLNTHPGGPNTILSWAGRDATKTWKMIHDTAWLNRYKESQGVICKGPVAPEDPVQLRQRQSDKGADYAETNRSTA
jgi:hypothetical protein